MKRIEFKKINKEMEELEELILEWYLEENNIHSMDLLNFELEEYEPEEIIRLVQYGTFDLEDDYFFFNKYNSLESTTREDIIEEIEELTEEDIEDLEKYLVDKLGV